VTDGSGFTIKQSGVLRPPDTRDVRHPHIIFSLIVPTQTQQTYYLRFKSGASMTLPLTLWNEGTFIESNAPQERLAGLFYGILIGLLVYNLFLLFSLREASSPTSSPSSYFNFIFCIYAVIQSLYILNYYLKPNISPFVCIDVHLVSCLPILSLNKVSFLLSPVNLLCYHLAASWRS
jgi:hypothetical protein